MPSPKRDKPRKGFSEADTIPEGSDIRIEGHRVGGPLFASLPVSTGGLSAASPLTLAWAKNRLARDVRHIVGNYHIKWHEHPAVTRICAHKVELPIQIILVVAEKQDSNRKWLRASKAMLSRSSASPLACLM